MSTARTASVRRRHDLGIARPSSFADDPYVIDPTGANREARREARWAAAAARRRRSILVSWGCVAAFALAAWGGWAFYDARRPLSEQELVDLTADVALRAALASSYAGLDPAYDRALLVALREVEAAGVDAASGRLYEAQRHVQAAEAALDRAGL